MIARVAVSLQAIQANARALAALISPAKAAFVVKANGYGHGIDAIAKTLQPYCERLCVYSMDEAVRLRDAGIRSALLVMGPVPPDALDEAIARGIEIALWDTGAYAEDIAQQAKRRGVRAQAHLKIDTGVARLGVAPRAARDAAARYVSLGSVEIAGIFSHLAAAEELDSPFTMTQLGRFESALEAAAPLLREARMRPQRHIAASAAAMLWPQTRLDMARIGIAVYGLWPSPQTRAAMNGAAPDLQPALQFESELVAIRDVEAGTPIGYGSSFHAPKRTRIGVVPLGYADGIPRALSNTGAFLVDGMRCPIAGRVCMNMTMLDLGDAARAHAGSRVTLIGRDGEAAVTADDWAAWANSINYEIVARLPEHLPREYRSFNAS